MLYQAAASCNAIAQQEEKFTASRTLIWPAMTNRHLANAAEPLVRRLSERYDDHLLQSGDAILEGRMRAEESAQRPGAIKRLNNAERRSAGRDCRSRNAAIVSP